MVKRTRTYRHKHSRRNLKRSRRTGRGRTTLKAMFTGKSRGLGFSGKKHLLELPNVKLPSIRLPHKEGRSHQSFLSFFTGK